MLKSDLILSLNKKYKDLSSNDIESVIDLFFNKITSSLIKGQNIELRGFGTLSKKNNKAKYVRNPRTNEKIFKDANFKIHFKIGKILHRRINSIK